VAWNNGGVDGSVEVGLMEGQAAAFRSSEQSSGLLKVRLISHVAHHCVA
jgi:hypothetical protein